MRTSPPPASLFRRWRRAETGPRRGARCVRLFIASQLTGPLQGSGTLNFHGRRGRAPAAWIRYRFSLGIPIVNQRAMVLSQALSQARRYGLQEGNPVQLLALAIGDENGLIHQIPPGPDRMRND